MVFQQQQQQQQYEEVIGRLYNRMSPTIISERNSGRSSNRSSSGSSETLITTTRSMNNFSLHNRSPPPPLLQRDRKRCSEGYDFLDIVKDAEDSSKYSKRSKAKAKKVRFLFQEQQQQQRHDEQFRELQQQAVAAIKAVALQEEILYYENRNRQNVIQTQNVLDMMEISSISSSRSEYYVDYNNIVYNDIIIENDHDNHNDDGCSLTHLVPFFQHLKDKFDDQLLQSIP